MRLIFNDVISSIIRVWRYQRVIRIRMSKKNRQHNGQKKKVQKDKQWSTKHTHKTKNWVTRIPVKPAVNSGTPYVPNWSFYVMLIRGDRNMDGKTLLYYIRSLHVELWKESLNNDGQQFYQYQQNEQLPLTSNNTTTYGVGNQGHRLEHTWHKCNRVKSVNGALFLTSWSLTTHFYKNEWQHEHQQYNRKGQWMFVLNWLLAKNI